MIKDVIIYETGRRQPKVETLKINILNMNKPQEISAAEWKEIIEIPVIRESWGIDEDVTPEAFADMVYGVKFDFASGGPGYVGDLYILQGDALGEPMTLIREHGKLVSR
jgi:hypothetical protein